MQLAWLGRLRWGFFQGTQGGRLDWGWSLRKAVLVQGRPIAAQPVSTFLAGGSWEVARCSGPKALDGPTLVQALELTLGFGHLCSSSWLLGSS